MLTAQEAKAKSEQALRDRIEQENTFTDEDTTKVSLMLKDIEERCKDCRFSLLYNYIPKQSVVNKLRELGYKVENSNALIGAIVISWSHI